jgi:PAS domain S-box-containing protein
MTNIAEAMKRAVVRTPVQVSINAKVIEAMAQMLEASDSGYLKGNDASPQPDVTHVDCVVVVDHERVLGLLTERDMVSFAAQRLPVEQLTLRQVLNHPPQTVKESELTDFDSVLNLFDQYHLSHLPILDENERLVGLISRQSIHQALSMVALQHKMTSEQSDNESDTFAQAEVQPSASEHHFASLVAASPVGILYTDLNGVCTYANDRYCEILGTETADLIGQAWHQAYHPQDLEWIQREFESSLLKNRPMQIEYRIQRADGTEVWVYGQSVRVHDSEGQTIGYVGTITDISDRKRAESLLASQHQLLERIAKAEPLTAIFDTLLKTMESFLAGAVCSITLCRDGRLSEVFAPSLPQDYTMAVMDAALPIVEGGGSCGTAIFRRELVVVTDINSDPLWKDYKSLVQDYGLQACASLPIFASDQTILGVFGIYFREKKAPKSYELEWIVQAANIAGIAIERNQATQFLQQVNQDLESRVQARTQDLREREQFLQTVLDTFPLSVFWKDVDSVYLGCNQNFLRDAGLHGFDEIIGKTDDELPWGKTEADIYRADDRMVIETQTAKLGIVEPQHKENGQSIWLETNKLPLLNLQGEVIGVLGTYQDITDRIVAEKALTLKQNHLEALLNNIPHITWIKDEQSRFIAVNEPFAQACGTSAEALVGKTDFDIWPAELAQIYRDDDASVLRSGQRKVVEERVARADGILGWLETIKTPFFDDLHSLAGTVGIAADITDRKQVEDKLQQTNEELLRATRLKDEFLANMSHELRTPLNAILGLSEGLQEEIFGPLNDRQKTTLTTIERSGQHLLSLINDILEVSKIAAGKLELEMNEVSIHHLCSSSLAFVKEQANRKRIQFHTHIPQNLSTIVVDERRMRQVLINLLTNAVKFTPNGGQVTLEIELERLSYQNQESAADLELFEESLLRVSVIDTGIGIAAADQLKLFQPFVQLDSSLNRKYEGTGLGLTLVKQIVELHGGSVILESEVGVGSCFTLRLPYYRPLARGAEQLETEYSSFPLVRLATGTGSNPLILLVEDNEANISTLSSYLTAKEYPLLLARNGQEAISLVQERQPDLILMDIQMPGMNGIEAIGHIRNTLKLVNCPIIALTALAMPGDRERCIEAGANDYLTKPVKLKQLVSRIQQLLAN